MSQLQYLQYTFGVRVYKTGYKEFVANPHGFRIEVVAPSMEQLLINIDRNAKALHKMVERENTKVE